MVVEIILAQITHVHHAFNVDVVQRNKNAKIRHAADFAREHFAHFVAHIVGFQPVFHITAGIVGAAFAMRRMRAERLPVGLVLCARQHGFDGAVHQQIGIAADGRGEMGVVLIRQPKMPCVVRLVLGLLHGAQQHGLQQFAVIALGDLVGKGGIIFGRGVIAAAQFQAQEAQLFAQRG